MLCSRGDRGFPLHLKGMAVVTATTVADPAVLERRISVDRLAPYKLATGGGLADALDLYQWNAEVSAGFWVVLGHLEILVRNAMHEQLAALSVSRRTGQDWYLALAGDFSSEACATIADARRHATANGRGDCRTRGHGASVRVLAVPPGQPLRADSLAHRTVPRLPRAGAAAGGLRQARQRPPAAQPHRPP